MLLKKNTQGFSETFSQDMAISDHLEKHSLAMLCLYQVPAPPFYPSGNLGLNNLHAYLKVI